MSATTKPHLICSAADLDQLRSMVREYWFLAADFDPLVATDDANAYRVRNAQFPDGRDGLRVVLRARRWRFEDSR